MRVEFYGLKFDLPQGWVDITDDLPQGAIPTLARPMGVGAIQFSIAKYQGGEDPCVTIENLKEFLVEFCRRNDMRCDEIMDRREGVISVGATSVVNGELISARYLSNGRDVVLATYVCSDPVNRELEEDLNGVEEIMNTIEF